MPFEARKTKSTGFLAEFKSGFKIKLESKPIRTYRYQNHSEELTLYKLLA